MSTYTSVTTISTTKPSVATDTQVLLKKFWLIIDVSDPNIYNLFNNFSITQDNSYLENITTQSDYDFKIGTPSINQFGYNAFITTNYLYQTSRTNWGGGTLGVSDNIGVIYSDGTPDGFLMPGVYQPPFTWEDGVWHLRSDFEFDESVTYSSDAYFLLTESLDCCITKYSSKLACNCSEKALAKATKMITYRDMAYRAFDAGDYNNASILIRKATELCNSTGCNCGCN